MSGCSEGHVVHWDIRSGNCVHDLGEYSVGVVKLESTRDTTVGLLSENTVVVWDNFNGETLYTLDMVRKLDHLYLGFHSLLKTFLFLFFTADAVGWCVL